MTVTLYELAGNDPDKKFSPHCWKSRLAIEHKKITCESQSVRFTEKDKIEFSGQPLLPVFVDGDNTVTDSWQVASYLEDNFPDSPSLFNDAAGKALAESINHWCDTDLAKHIRPIILMDIYGLIAEKDRVYFRESREGKIGMTLEEFSAKADAAIQGLRSELEKIREIISMQPYIGGQSPSYADICLLGTFMWIACVNKVEFLDKQDSVYDWYQRMLEQYPVAKKAANA
ncbi:MAG: glutathione S-transferase N-terminal domain-containing protein [Cellvibrionaceae bacterium]